MERIKYMEQPNESSSYATSIFCSKCGNQCPVESGVCSACGAQLIRPLFTPGSLPFGKMEVIASACIGVILIIFWPRFGALAGLGAVGWCIFIKKKMRKSNVSGLRLAKAGVWGGVGVFVLSMAIMMGVTIPMWGDQSSQNAAIVRALTYDAEISKRQSDSGNKVRYLSELSKIPLSGCPSNFTKAYRKHIAAWRADDKAAIEETWRNVLLVAYDHGVDCEKYVELHSSSSSSANGLSAAAALLQILSGAAQQQGSSYNQQQQQSGWQVRQQQQRQIDQDILRDAQLNEYYPNRVPYSRVP